MAIIHHFDWKTFNTNNNICLRLNQRKENVIYLLELELQLRDDLHLDPGLGGALVVQDVFRSEMFLELSTVLTPHVTPGPLTQTWGSVLSLVFLIDFSEWGNLIGFKENPTDREILINVNGHWTVGVTLTVIEERVEAVRLWGGGRQDAVPVLVQRVVVVRAEGAILHLLVSLPPVVFRVGLLVPV